MVVASELKPGMVIRSEGQVYKVLDMAAKAGAAKMGGVVFSGVRPRRHDAAGPSCRVLHSPASPWRHTSEEDS